MNNISLIVIFIWLSFLTIRQYLLVRSIKEVDPKKYPESTESSFLIDRINNLERSSRYFNKDITKFKTEKVLLDYHSFKRYNDIELMWLLSNYFELKFYLESGKKDYKIIPRITFIQLLGKFEETIKKTLQEDK